MPETSPRPVLVVYTKPACPLCEEALDVVREAQAMVPFEWEERNILSDSAWYERWKHAIPAGYLGEREVFRFRTDATSLVRALGIRPTDETS